MAAHDIVVIGASAGGIEATSALLAMLPGDLPAVVFVVVHRHPRIDTFDYFLQILSEGVRLPVRAAVHGSPFRHGEVVVAPPGVHLMVGRGVVELEQSPKEQRARPSIDVLFRSAAAVYGRRVVGVVLTGMLFDGSAGLWQINKHGGITIVQDPFEAAYGDMPQNALDSVPMASSLPLEEIGRTLIELCLAEPTPPSLTGTRDARILVVEDERIVALDLVKRLQALGYTVAGSVSSGEEALRIVTEVNPDLVLVDVLLGGRMRGTDAARALWERYQLPVVYLTAYSDDLTLDAANQSMPYGYIVKPYRPEQIDATIQLALARRERESLPR